MMKNIFLSGLSMTLILSCLTIESEANTYKKYSIHELNHPRLGLVHKHRIKRGRVHFLKRGIGRQIPRKRTIGIGLFIR
jgi:hypothetical protein